MDDSTNNRYHDEGPDTGPQDEREQAQGDPYRTVGSNTQPGWQQQAPPPVYTAPPVGPEVGAPPVYTAPAVGPEAGPPPGYTAPQAGPEVGAPPPRYTAPAQRGPQAGWSAAPDYSANYRGARPPQQNGAYKWNFDEYAGADAGKKNKKKRRGLMVFTGIVCTLFAITVLGFAGYGALQLMNGAESLLEQKSPEASPEEATSPQLSLNDIPREAESEIISPDGRLTPTQVASKVRPSVVGIVAYMPNTGNGLYDFGNALAQSEGSGIIMSADGYIITNAHVVAGANGIKVVLNNDEEYDAKLIGSDVATDLAVVKIEASNLTPAEFGDSKALEVGEYVAAIGNPGGLLLSNSMTQGIVSGINRPLNSGDGYTMNFIQTDAAINPGNSGGALVNEYGQVIGINSVKIAETEYEGLGFAIPISEAKPIVDDLIANGKVTGRVRLGIEGREIDEMTARYNNVPTGFQVTGIDAASDFSAQGVVAGDIITKIDGKDIVSIGSIRDYLRDFKPGDKVTLTVFRRTSGRQDTTFEATISLIEEANEAVQGAPSIAQ